MDVFTTAQQKSFDDFMTVYRSGDEHSHYGGHSLLFYALANSNSESRYRIATFLLNQHADLGDVDNHKNNLLHILFRGFNQEHHVAEDIELARRLIGRGVDAAAPNRAGTVPLMHVLAAKDFKPQEHEPLIDLWLEQPHPGLKHYSTEYGGTALDIALRRPYWLDTASRIKGRLILADGLVATVSPHPVLARLVFILTDAGIGVTIKNRVLSIGREQNVRSVLFWSQDELWHVGYHSTRFTDRHTENLKIATLSTPDIEVALRWLICRTANQYRTHSKRCWAQLLPLRTAGRFASGWSAEQVSVKDSYVGTVEARLIQPDGLPLHMRMATALPHAIELAALSHLMEFSPQQVLDAYLDPDGSPLPVHLLERGIPDRTMGDDFYRLVTARGKAWHYLDDEIQPPGNFDRVPHFWCEDGCWHYGHTERGELRSPDVSSPHFAVILRWAAYDVLNDARADNGWPMLLTNYWKPRLAPVWATHSPQEHPGCVCLITPTGSILNTVIHSANEKNAAALSHLMSLNPTEVIDCFVQETGGRFHEQLDPGPSSAPGRT